MPEQTSLPVTEHDEDWREAYRYCKFCGKPLNEDMFAFACSTFQTMYCSPECHAKDELKTFGCCDQAYFIPCVCYFSCGCPVHGETHKGTHD